MEKCSCGKSLHYLNCCAEVISGKRKAVSPEELMRSRYSAFVHQEIDYLMKTHAPEFRPDDRNEIADWAAQVQWEGLEVLNVKTENETGWVEFKAHYIENNEQYVLHENSFFRKEEGEWFYVNGEVPQKPIAPKECHIERNSPCPCGSGKKYKKCCMKA